MYLKSIEMVGFKSFAERTQLVFEPGMMAIVGPNGCGKSNVSDAIRWVLGEQSPKALRGAAMTDVIFNGTDTARPLAMAEVSLTFTDCEQTLGTDYHDVTVTRRVFRSGEGQYFLNRSPCRLRDIQRLFLDTGIGTSSYCVMEQGHIDLILSSRPDDRRAVFEEASGVARFKADRREALRKLDHTQANLDRADDVIRELSRQLVSLQRQAGKARRYKALRERLAALEAYLGRLRLSDLDSSLAALDRSLAAKRAEEEKLKSAVESASTAAETLRAAIGELETAIAAALDEAAAAKSRKAMAEERVRANRERAAELDTLFARDDAETQSAHAALALHAETLAALETEKAQTSAAAEAAAATDREKQAALASADAETRTLRERLQQLRQEAVQLEGTLARRQAELDQLEAASRSNRLRKERLLSEKDDAERAAAGFAERLASLADEAAALEAKSADAAKALAAAEKKRQTHAAALADTQRAAAALQRSLSATQAKIELVKGAKAAVGFPPGARKLLKDPRLAGTLADRVRAEKPYARALETALRPWLDALLCETPETALALCGELVKGKVGSARFLFPGAGEPPATPDGAGEPLLAHVKPAKAWSGVLSRLLSRVRVVPDATAVPLPLAADGPDYVTQDGIFVSASGAAELFLPQADESNPLSLAEQRREWEAEVERLAAEEAEKRQSIASLEKELAASGKEAADARAAMDAARRDAARAEGGRHVVERERDAVLARAAAIARDLAALEKATGGEESRRAALAGEMEEKRTRLASARAETESGSAALSAAEEARAACVEEATEARVAALSLAQQRDAVAARFAPLRARIGELNALVADRERAKEGYAARKHALEEETARAVAGIPGLEAAEKAAAAALDEARKGRDEKRAALAGCDAETRALRGKYDEVRDARAAEEVRRERDAITRENLLGRLRSDWELTPDDVAAAGEPDWKAVAGSEEKLSAEAMEAFAGDLKEKIRLIGPVNLDSLSEAQEIEERYAFFTKQAKDLGEAKEKLVKLIGEIDATTKTLFEETFRKVNENFQDLFGRLFGGGQAHLALVDESNILESGIDIVAKPPGKKPQTVSLLSGGERTLTALALLFALFKVKPSPFCLTDELDAPLDETNITRYLDMLRSFLGTTQFLVITHNAQTIAAAKALYGVTMEKRGISKIVSVKFAEAIAEAEAEAARTRGAAARRGGGGKV